MSVKGCVVGVLVTFAFHVWLEISDIKIKIYCLIMIYMNKIWKNAAHGIVWNNI